MSVSNLKAAYEKLEQQAYKAAAKAEKDPSDENKQTVRDLWEQAAEAQKEWLDAQVAESLMDRPDGPGIAVSLGITLPDED